MLATKPPPRPEVITPSTVRRPYLEKLAYEWCSARRRADQAINYNELTSYLRPLDKSLDLDTVIEFARTFVNFFFFQETDRLASASSAAARSARAPVERVEQVEQTRQSLLRTAATRFVTRRRSKGWALDADMLARQLRRDFRQLEVARSEAFAKDFLANYN